MEPSLLFLKTGHPRCVQVCVYKEKSMITVYTHLLPYMQKELHVSAIHM